MPTWYVLIIKSNLWQKDRLISLACFCWSRWKTLSHSQHAAKSNRWKMWSLRRLKQQWSTQISPYYKRTGNEGKPWRTGSTKPRVTFEAHRPRRGRSLIRARGLRTTQCRATDYCEGKWDHTRAVSWRLAGGHVSSAAFIWPQLRTLDFNPGPFLQDKHCNSSGIMWNSHRNSSQNPNISTCLQHVLSCTMITATVL